MHNRRKEKRYNIEADCSVSKVDVDSLPQNTSLICEMQNLSENGIGIKYSGEEIAPCSTVEIYIKNLDMHMTARVMWSDTIDKQRAISGLLFNEPIYISDIRDFIQNQPPKKNI